MDAAEKCGYPHFMIKEINEQPKACKDTMRPRIIKEGNGKETDVYFEEKKTILLIGYIMNTRIMQIRALDKKTSSLTDARNIVSRSTGWINTVR